MFRERFWGVSGGGLLPDLRPEIPSRTESGLQSWIGNYPLFLELRWAKLRDPNRDSLAI